MLAIAFILGIAGQTKAQNMSKVPAIRLNNGAEMPQLGVGTFLVTGKDAPCKISYALRHGYRLIDTAQAYGNEKEVGKGIKTSGVERGWHMQRGLITMPRCDNAEYVRENAAIFDFELSPAEMEIISGLNRNQRTNAKNDPDNFPW